MAMSRRSWEQITWHHTLFIAALRRMPLQRSERFPGSPPSSTPLSYCRTPPLSDCSLRGRPCPLVTILSQCLPALRLPSSTGCADWPTDRCIKGDSDYNWSLRTNYTRWKSDNVIMQLTSTSPFIKMSRTDGRTDGRADGRSWSFKVTVKHYTTLMEEGRRGES